MSAENSKSRKKKAKRKKTPPSKTSPPPSGNKEKNEGESTHEDDKRVETPESPVSRSSGNTTETGIQETQVQTNAVTPSSEVGGNTESSEEPPTQQSEANESIQAVSADDQVSEVPTVQDNTLITHEGESSEIEPLPVESGCSTEDTTILSGETAIAPISVEEDQARSRIAQYIKSKIAYSTPVDLRKQLLPNEQHLNSKLVIYFSEGQIFLGLFFILLAFILLVIYSNLLIFWNFVIIGVLLNITGYASEELHITDFRIMVRRMNWVDRFFRIPRDSQYIINEIVSFEIERAPMHLALLYSAILPWSLLLVPGLRNTIVLTIVILTSLTLVILSQRLNKRTIYFNMSGGHEVQLGIYKGIPADVVESFIDIVMEKNIFESDEY